MDFAREALDPKPGHSRTPEEAMQLYSAGLGFLESHVALTRLCQRTAGTSHRVQKDSFGHISPRQEQFEKMAAETQISCALLSDQGRGYEIRNKSVIGLRDRGLPRTACHDSKVVTLDGK